MLLIRLLNDCSYDSIEVFLGEGQKFMFKDNKSPTVLGIRVFSGVKS